MYNCYNETYNFIISQFIVIARIGSGNCWLFRVIFIGILAKIPDIFVNFELFEFHVSQIVTVFFNKF